MIVSIIMTVIALGGFLWGMHRFSYVILLGLFLMVLGFSYISARLYVKKQPEMMILATSGQHSCNSRTAFL